MSKKVKVMLLVNIIAITLCYIIGHKVRRDKQYVTANLNNFMKYRYY